MLSATTEAQFGSGANDFDDVSVPSINGNETAATWDLLVMPYVKNADIFGCPSDAAVWPASMDAGMFCDPAWFGRRLKRSYGIVGQIVDDTSPNDYTPDPNTGVTYNTADGEPTGRALTAFDQPAASVELLENWQQNDGEHDSWVGNFLGFVFWGCDARELPGRTSTTDLAAPCGESPLPAAKGHPGGVAMTFVDGHSKVVPWGQIRKDDFWVFKVDKPAN